MSLPFVTHENQVKVFNFYQTGNIYQATFFRSRLHKLVRLFELGDRTTAYRLGYELAEETTSVLITVSIDGYKVWTDLRSDAQPQPLDQRKDSAQPTSLLDYQVSPAARHDPPHTIN